MKATCSICGQNMPIIDPSPGDRVCFELRKKLKTVMQQHGSVHVQIAKAYDYLNTREPRLADLVRDIKKSVDPKNQINSGLWVFKNLFIIDK